MKVMGLAVAQEDGCCKIAITLIDPNGGRVAMAESPICDRIAFASWTRETGLQICPPEKRAAKLVHGVSVGHFSSPVCGQDLRNCGHFAWFFGKWCQVSLHFRLRGGGRGIRTPGTVSRTAVFKMYLYSSPSLVSIIYMRDRAV